MLPLWIAGAWGFAEATFFFLVPDVLLSYMALESFAAAFAGSLAALAGALQGGALMWLWGRSNHSKAKGFLLGIPAIHQPLLNKVCEQIASRGLSSTFLGPLLGIPYKIYAVEAGAQNKSLIAFLLLSIPARYLRFIGAVGAFWLAGHYMPFTIFGKRVAVTVFWVVFYTLYFRRFRTR